MKIIVCDKITMCFERTSDETLCEFLDYYGDLQYLIAVAKTDLGLYCNLSIQGNEIKVELVVQNIWIDEQKAAWFFAWVMMLFVDQDGNKTYTEEIAALVDDRLTIRLYNKQNDQITTDLNRNDHNRNDHD